MMNPRQRAFADCYLANGMNATQAAIEAGYSERTARSQGNRLLTKVDVKNYIKGRTEELTRERIVSGDEVLAFLSDVMCGTLEQTYIGIDQDGNVRQAGYVDQRNQIKAAELLAKCHGLTVQRIDMQGPVSITFVDDLGDDEEPSGDG